ncbi:MAG: hypothetical protein IPM13_17645 [Phycisphaerales bacterium]|nr:hypothetical protein [Phycisphaerales bacterium]
MFIDTGNGSDVLITGRLSIVALEAADSALTGDLLPGDPEVTLSDPFGEIAGPRLLDAPPATYVAVHLLFASQEVAGTLPDNSTVVITLPRRDFRLALSQPLVLSDGPQSWFTLRHDGPVELVRTAEGLTWDPRWLAQTAEVELVRAARVRVTAFDAAQYLIDGLLGLDELPVVLDLSGADTLSRDDQLLDRDAFFALLQADDILTIDGWLDRWRNVRVIAGSIGGDGGGREKSEVRGEIVELYAERSAFLLHVLQIRKDRAGLPHVRPLRLTVRVDDATRIKWVPRLGRHRGHLPFGALRAGMLVDVEWHGPAPELRVTAKKVDIHAASRHELTGRLHGDVTEVDLRAGVFVLDAPGDRTFRLGGERFATLRVRVDDGSILVRRDERGLRRIGLAEVPVGAHVHMVSERVEGNLVHALLVWVR